jgi:hypothetical protein
MGRFNFRNIFSNMRNNETNKKTTQLTKQLKIVQEKNNNRTTQIQNINKKNENLKKDKKNENLKKDKKNIEAQLKLKTEEYNKLLNDYNIQLKDKQGAMDYLSIKEHFSTIEGLTPAESEAVVEITGNLDKNFYNSIVNQNKQLDAEIQNYKNNYSTDDQKVFYQSQQVDYLNLFNSYLFIIYYALFLVLCYFLYYSKTLSKYMRIGMVILITLYPFIIMTVEKNIFVVLMYIFAVINGNAYIKNY